MIFQKPSTFQGLPIADVLSFLVLYTLVYLRHGKATPAAEGQPDVTRKLDEIGVGEARKAFETRAKAALGWPTLVVSSPARRCQETVLMGSDVSEELVVVRSELYCEATGVPQYAEADLAYFRESYARLGNAPNEQYFSFPGANGDAAFRRWTDGDGEKGGALRAIAEEILQRNLDPGCVVLISGHGNFGPFVVQRFSEEFGDAAIVERMQTHQLGTADAYVLRQGRLSEILEIAR